MAQRTSSASENDCTTPAATGRRALAYRKTMSTYESDAEKSDEWYSIQRATLPDGERYSFALCKHCGAEIAPVTQRHNLSHPPDCPEAEQ